MGNNSSLVEQLVTASANIPALGAFFKTSIMVDTLRKLGDSHFDLAIHTLNNLNSYSVEREALRMLLGELKIAHKLLYEQRLEFYKNMTILSYNQLILSAYNYPKIQESRYKEAYAACLIAVIHNYLDDGFELVAERLIQASCAIYDRPIFEQDEKFFNPIDVKSKILVNSAMPLAAIGFFANPQNWEEEDEAEKKAFNQQLKLLAENLHKIRAEKEAERKIKAIQDALIEAFSKWPNSEE
ncbi:hypothetical protein LC613_42995 [Nostoc sphaeroides CHAB 2801]|uniref:hypothetical protein n=1 Tax=Nostoc sphaeroides TaxID=446679 RepID=UPI001E33B960|nr:hypothetical protein [Nostoc sphaeroides]MCC5634171.1 hypothetical protein [Nostoc sphaeroides CHAB 2801]